MFNKKLFIILSALTLSVLLVTVLLWKEQPISPILTEPDCIELAGGVHIYNIEEYKKFVNVNTNLPVDFVTADMIKDIGIFHAFICNSETDFSVYSYSLLLDNGCYITLRVNHNGYNNLEKTEPIIDIVKVGSSMKTLTTADRGRILSNGIEYRYINGNLYYIEWIANDILFGINLNSNDPSVSSNSVIGKILSTSTDNHAAALELLTAITVDNSKITE